MAELEEIPGRYSYGRSWHLEELRCDNLLAVEIRLIQTDMRNRLWEGAKRQVKKLSVDVLSIRNNTGRERETYSTVQRLIQRIERV